MIIISARNVCKSYGKKSASFKALSNINLDIKQGESLAIIGKSGSGKSTLMHSLALLERPTTGEVLIDGHLVTKMTQKQMNLLRNRKFGFVFQQFFMNSRDTVFSNVMLPLKISGVPVKDRKAKVMKALEVVELTSKAKNKATNLSGGEKQRVCIARALVNNPQVIFADEPTGNLDSTTGQKIEDLLFELNKKQGITLIIVTHDADLASRCQRQVAIKDGQIITDKQNVKMTIVNKSRRTQ